MALFAISDTHLNFSGNKTMDIFGAEWTEHHLTIKENWLKTVKESDTVLMPGDISWGMRLNEAEPDLEFIDGLPGEKIISRGNHDYWWGSVSKLNESYKSIRFLQNDFYVYDKNDKTYAICATRGWLCPGDSGFSAADRKIYNREQIRLRLSLDAAVSGGYEKIILMLHYPPTNEKQESSAFTDIITSYPAIEKIIFGHIHGKHSYSRKKLAAMLGRSVYLVSSDQAGFNPVKIL